MCNVIAGFDCMYIAEFQEGHPLCLLIKSVAEEQRIITVTVDKDAIQDALVRYIAFLLINYIQ